MAFRKMLVLALMFVGANAFAGVVDISNPTTNTELNSVLNRDVMEVKIAQANGQYALVITSELNIDQNGQEVSAERPIDAEGSMLIRTFTIPVKASIKTLGVNVAGQIGGAGSTNPLIGSFKNFNGLTVADLMLPMKGFAADLGIALGGLGFHTAVNAKGIVLSGGARSALFMLPAGLNAGVQGESTNIQFAPDMSKQSVAKYNTYTIVKEGNTTVQKTSEESVAFATGIIAALKLN